MGEWKDISTAPRDGTRVLVTYKAPATDKRFSCVAHWDRLEVAWVASLGPQKLAGPRTRLENDRAPTHWAQTPSMDGL